MSTSLRDQLLKAGLVSEKQVKEAERRTRKAPRQERKSTSDGKPTAAQRALAEKAARDRELNRRLAEKAEAKARASQVREIIDQHRLPPSDDGEPFHFQDGRRIKRIYVDAEQRRRIVDGSLAIARYGKRFALIPPEAARKVRERDPGAIVDLTAATSTGPEDVDDAYKGFEVPDDLMW